MPTACEKPSEPLARAEALGLKVPLAKAHYLKASVLRAKGDPAARREYAAALRLLEEVKRDGGNENVLKRADLAACTPRRSSGRRILRTSLPLLSCAVNVAVLLR